jgi:hypothetical protein
VINTAVWEINVVIVVLESFVGLDLLLTTKNNVRILPVVLQKQMITEAITMLI